MPGKVEIKSILAEQTWPVRHQVMWPHRPLSYVQLPQDEQGKHYGVFVNEQLVSVISLFIEEKQAQFRKFATMDAFQKQGLGTKLLHHLFSVAEKEHITAIWCHARTTAVPFYQKAGMQVVGESFERDGKLFVKMNKLYFEHS